MLWKSPSLLSLNISLMDGPKVCISVTSSAHNGVFQIGSKASPILPFGWIRKFCKSRVYIFPGKYPVKRDWDGKFPVSREAKKSGKLQTLLTSLLLVW